MSQLPCQAPRMLRSYSHVLLQQVVQKEEVDVSTHRTLGVLKQKSCSPVFSHFSSSLKMVSTTLTNNF